MRKMKLIICIIATGILFGNVSTNISLEGGKAMHFCGRTLIDALILLCTMEETHSSAEVQPSEQYILKNTLNEMKANYKDIKSKLSRRQKRDLVDTCCYKPCKYEDLRMYC
ncbi:PREDICTED: insulin-like [Papilio xuthus]|uniref:Insulin-like n=1 Tax=Papilio xuthus TaxID=66420 RepID=A0AAJ6ZV27_PAPXU|nr:PREDICTED: insulin-like [Papilio xuthus]